MHPGVDVAQAALRGGAPQTALEIAGNVLATAPGNEAALVVQGDALTDLGRVDEARISYTNALQRILSRSAAKSAWAGWTWQAIRPRPRPCSWRRCSTIRATRKR